MSTLLTTLLTAVLLLSPGGRLAAQLPPLAGCPVDAERILEDVVATQTFQERVAAYVTVHQLLEGPLPPLEVGRDLGPVRETTQALQLRIQRSRVNARQGDIITPEVARMFRRNIVACLTREEWAALFAEMRYDEQGRLVPPPPALHVNMPWPAEVAFEFVPPQLLQALPRLPVELQYRIIGRDLVLWDHHANLIVDWLPGAFVNES
jgi:hypothetical protein